MTIPHIQRQKSEVWLNTKVQYGTTIVICVLALILPMILNGFPYFFPDSIGYILPATHFIDVAAMAMGIDINSGFSAVSTGANSSVEGRTCDVIFCHNPFFMRPFPYTAFLFPFAKGVLIYLAPIAQALIVLWSIFRFMAACSVRANPIEFLATVLLLAVGTCLPVHVNHLMPDIFSGILILSVAIVLVCWRSAALRDKLVYWFLLTFLACVHLSHIPLFICLGIAALLWCVVMKPNSFNIAGVTAVCILPAVLGGMLLTASNVILSKQPVMSLSSPLFLLARLSDGGFTSQYLSETCREKRYMICDYMDRMNVPAGEKASFADYFLWGKEGVYKSIGPNKAFITEAREINREIMKSYPVGVAAFLLNGSVKQVVTFDDDFQKQRISADSVGYIYKELADKTPDWGKRYKLSGQYDKASYAYASSDSVRHWGRLLVILISLLAIPVLFRLINRKHARLFIFPVYLSICGVVCNGMIAGALSSVHDRYQGRVIWIIPLIAFTLLIAFYRDRSSKSANN